MFKDFWTEVEKQLDKNIKSLQSDRDGEYLSGDFNKYLLIMGFYPIYVLVEWCGWKKKPDSFRHDKIYDELFWSTKVPIGICFENNGLYSKLNFS